MSAMGVLMSHLELSRRYRRSVYGVVLLKQCRASSGTAYYVWSVASIVLLIDGIVAVEQ